LVKNFHEEFERPETTSFGSERGFGVLFAIVFLVIGLWPLISEESVRFWAVGIAAVFATLAVVAPQVLLPLNRFWVRFGLLLQRLATPIMLGLIFFLTVFPTGLVMRLMGKDPLNLRFHSHAETYWIERPVTKPARDEMKNQF